MPRLCWKEENKVDSLRERPSEMDERPRSNIHIQVLQQMPHMMQPPDRKRQSQDRGAHMGTSGLLLQRDRLL